MAFGSSIKLTGESEYKKALNEITQGLKVMSAEMKATASGYEAGEKSEKEVIATSKEMKKALDEQKEALEKVKAQLPDLISKYNEAGARHKKLTEELKIEEKTLEEVKKRFGESSKEYKEQKKVVDDLTKEVDKSGKEYEKLGKDVDNTKIQIAKAETTINKTTVALDDMGKEAEESGEEAEKGSEGFSVMKGALANLASSAISACIDGLKNLGAAIVGVISDVGEMGDEIDKESQKLGVSAETYQELSYAMERSGASIDDVSKGVTNITNALADTQNGVKGASDTFDALGVSLQNADGSFKSTEDVLMESIDALASMEDETQRNALANDVFGKSYKELAPLLNSGSEGIQALMQEAEDYGMVMSQDAVNASAAYEDSLTKLEGTMGGIKSNIAGEFLPSITQIINGFSDLAIGSEGAGEQIKEGISGIISKVKDLLPQAASFVKEMANAVMEVAPEIISALVDGITSTAPEIIPVVLGIAESVVETLLSKLPDILNAGVQILLKLVNGIKTTIPKLVKMLPTIIKEIVKTLVNLLPEIIKTGTEILISFIEGITDAIPELIKMLPTIIDTMVNVLTQNLPLILNAGVQIILALADGLVKALPELVKQIPNIIKSMLDAFTKEFPKMISIGADIIKSLVKGLGDNLGRLGDKALELGKTLLDKVGEGIKNIADVGKDLVEGVWNGISDHVSWIVDKIKGFGKSVTDAVKKAFGIQSPSKVMRDSVGKYLAQGIGVGFTQEMQSVARDMQDAIPNDFTVSAQTSGGSWAYDNLVSAFKTALSEMKIEMDGDEMGRFVDKTVTRLVYA